MSRIHRTTACPTTRRKSTQRMELIAASVCLAIVGCQSRSESTALRSYTPAKQHSNQLMAQNHFHKSDLGNDAGGFSSGPGYSIVWCSETTSDPDKASPLMLLQTVLDRMEFVQSTAQSSDRNARALWHVLQARDSLSGDTPLQKLESPLDSMIPTSSGLKSKASHSTGINQ